MSTATLERYSVRFNGFADIDVMSIGEVEAIAAARMILIRDRGVRMTETLQSGRVTFVSLIE